MLDLQVAHSVGEYRLYGSLCIYMVAKARILLLARLIDLLQIAESAQQRLYSEDGLLLCCLWKFQDYVLCSKHFKGSERDCRYHRL